MRKLQAKLKQQKAVKYFERIFFPLRVYPYPPPSPHPLYRYSHSISFIEAHGRIIRNSPSLWIGSTKDTNYFQSFLEPMIPNGFGTPWKRVDWCSAWGPFASSGSELHLCSNRVDSTGRERNFSNGSTLSMEAFRSVHPRLPHRWPRNIFSNTHGDQSASASIHLVAFFNTRLSERQLPQIKTSSEEKEAKAKKVCLFRLWEYRHPPGISRSLFYTSLSGRVWLNISFLHMSNWAWNLCGQVSSKTGSKGQATSSTSRGEGPQVQKFFFDKIFLCNSENNQPPPMSKPYILLQLYKQYIFARVSSLVSILRRAIGSYDCNTLREVLFLNRSPVFKNCGPQESSLWR